jgi:aromatic ring-opening dioxygenase catalytic subunit (LigB family)
MTSARRLPSYFVSHGGGPWPWIKDMLPGDFGPLERSLQQMARDVQGDVKAVLCISAHWETNEFTVMTAAQPGMVYDYGGFPDFTYRISYPSPGAPQVAERVAALLEAASLPVRRDGSRGIDHGVYAVTYPAWPNADIPVLQLSIRHDYDPATHLACGRALAPLRDEGVLIVGSGFSYHNMRGFGGAGAAPSADFDRWLSHSMCAVSPEERTERLLRWDAAPSARACHPAEDHLVPLFVAVGAAEHEVGTRCFHQSDFFGSITASSFRFG